MPAFLRRGSTPESTIPTTTSDSVEAPAWLKVDTTLFVVTVQGVPTLVESGIEGADLQSLIEFYSR